MSSFDNHKNFAISHVATAPSPASSGTSLTVTSGDGARFPTAPSFNATVWPEGVEATAANAEIVRVTWVSSDTFTIVRQAELSAARAIQVGDQIAATITAKTITDIEGASASLILTSPYTISVPTEISIAVTDGAILFVEITQDATGHAVTWDTMFEGAPAVSTAPYSITTAMFVGVGGTWVISSAIEISTRAPAALSVTGSITGYQQYYNGTRPVFGGVITLATSDPNYSHDKRFEVQALSPSGTAYPLDGCIFYAPFAGSTIAFSGPSPSILQTVAAQPGWGLLITPYNEFNQPGTPTLVPSNYPASSLTIAAVGISSVGGSEVGPRTINSSQETLTTVRLTGTLTNASEVTQWICRNATGPQSEWLWQWLGWEDQPAGAFTWDWNPFVPFSAQTWAWAACPGAQSAPPTGSSALIATSALPAGTAIQATPFAVAAIGAPSSAGVTGLSVTAGPTYAGINSLDNPYWTLTVGGTIPSGYDPATWYFSVTVEGCDVSGNPDPGPSPNSGEREWFQFVNQTGGATMASQTLLGNYNAVGTAYPCLKLRCYAVSRVSTVTPGFQDPTSVPQDTWPGPATSQIVNFQATLGTNLGVGLGTGLGVTSGLATASGGGTLVQAPPQLSLNSQYYTTSMLSDPSFYGIGYLVQEGIFPASMTSDLNGHWAWSTFCSMAGGTITIKTDGGFDDAYYVRLTGGPYAGIQQPISVTPGQTLNISCEVRSNNPSLSGGQTHSFTLQVGWYDKNLNAISSAPIATATGYIATWEKLSAYTTVPSNAAYALVYVCTLSTEAPTGYWDVDTVLAQNVVSQTGNAQTTSMAPESTSSDYTALRVLSTVNAGTSNWGLALAQMTAADGSFFELALETASATINLAAQGGGLAQIGSSAGEGFLRLDSPNNQEIFGVDAQNSPGLEITVTHGGVVHVGTYETLAAAISAGRHVVAGLIVP